MEIAGNAWNYVKNSWYNNWTSFLIESLFKQNPRVVPVIGEIKNVDFFIDDYPLDLKVTFFPNQYMEEKLRPLLGKSRLSWLKKRAASLDIRVDNALSAATQTYILKEKLYEHGYESVLNELNTFQRQVIVEARENPLQLIKWLYENQGEMRFGAENRLYLILEDVDHPEQSWKLKRAFSIMQPVIREYLDKFTDGSLKPIQFQYNKKNYSSLSDALFITRGLDLD